MNGEWVVSPKQVESELEKLRFEYPALSRVFEALIADYYHRTNGEKVKFKVFKVED